MLVADIDVLHDCFDLHSLRHRPYFSCDVARPQLKLDSDGKPYTMLNCRFPIGPIVLNP